MSEDLERVYNYLCEMFDTSPLLKTIFHTFEFCSRDKNNQRYLVNSQVKAINFDILTQWIYGSNAIKSADSMSFAGEYIYLIEFKTGDQLKYDNKKHKLIQGCIGKINDSDETLYEHILSKTEPPCNTDNKLRYYLVVDTNIMGINALATELAKLSLGSSLVNNPKIESLLTEVLPNLKEGTKNSEHFNDIDIWYSELFDTYLNKYGIVDIMDSTNSSEQ